MVEKDKIIRIRVQKEVATEECVLDALNCFLFFITSGQKRFSPEIANYAVEGHVTLGEDSLK
jgi:hypothetical protein